MCEGFDNKIICTEELRKSMSEQAKKTFNTLVYKELLKRVFTNRCESNSYGIVCEVINAVCQFRADGGIIEGTSKSYIQHELDWYESQDLCIIGHKGIENNPIWKQCATKDGMVNSNYGWCIWSKENYRQYEKAREYLINNKNTKQAIMVYSRPEIQIHHHDLVHAKRDMICTIYVDCLIRDNKLIYIVHMRSNDVWYGMRNDLAWHLHVYDNLYNDLIKHYPDLIKGQIIWNADSLHLYARNLEDVEKYLGLTVN